MANSVEHLFHSIDADLLLEYCAKSRDILDSLCSEMNSIVVACSLAEPLLSTNDALDGLRHFLLDWEWHDNNVHETADLMSQAPPGIDISQIYLTRLGSTNICIGWLRNGSRKPLWGSFPATDQANIVAHDLELLYQIDGVPDILIRQADDAFAKRTEELIPTFTAALRGEVDINFTPVGIPVRVGRELSGELTTYRDGSLEIVLEANGEVGAELRDIIGGGIEGSVRLQFRFNSQEEVDEFLNGIREAVSPDKSDVLTFGAGYVLGPAGILLGSGAVIGKKVAELSSYVYSNDSLVSARGKLGLWGRAGGSIGGPVSKDCELRFSGGFGYDAKTEETIQYFGGDLELKVPGSGTVVEASLYGEELHGPMGDRVIIEGTLFGGVSVVGPFGGPIEGWFGQEGDLRLELDLEDPVVRDAWSSFLRAEFNFIELFEHSHTTIHSSVKLSGGLDINAEFAGVEIEGSAKDYFASYIKRPGRPLRLVGDPPLIGGSSG